MKELVILRKNNFRMQISEEELGFNVILRPFLIF